MQSKQPLREIRPGSDLENGSISCDVVGEPHISGRSRIHDRLYLQLVATGNRVTEAAEGCSLLNKIIGSTLTVAIKYIDSTNFSIATAIVVPTIESGAAGDGRSKIFDPEPENDPQRADRQVSQQCNRTPHLSFGGSVSPGSDPPAMIGQSELAWGLSNS